MYTVLFKISLYKDSINHILINSTYWVEKGRIDIRAAPTGSEVRQAAADEIVAGVHCLDCCSSLK